MGEERPTEEKDGHDELTARIGTFLILLGIFFFILFVASDFAEQPDFDWLFLGMLFLVFGFFLNRRGAPRPSAGRFSTLNKLRSRAKQRREERDKKTR